jgi:surface antigen
MKLKTKFTVITFAAALLLILNTERTNSSIVQPAAGNNGAPNTIPANQTCAQCHSGGAPKDANPMVDFTFNDGITSVHAADFAYELDKTYIISYVPLTTSKRYGFQMSALTSTNANGGTFSITDPTNTTKVSTPTTYVAHHNASSFHFWTFQWKAPATNVGDITFYYAFNASDSNDAQTGDTIYVGSATIQAATTGIKDADAVSHLSVYPNPVKGEMNVSFTATANQAVELNLYSLDGKLVKQLGAEKNVTLFNSTFNLADVSCGIYLLQIKAGNKLSCRKVVVE